MNAQDGAVHICSSQCQHYTEKDTPTYFDEKKHVTKAQAANEVFISERTARNCIYIGFISTFIAAAVEDIVVGGIIAVITALLLGIYFVKTVKHMNYLNETYNLGYKKFSLKDIRIDNTQGAKQ